jgi:hypothetical protein
VIKGGTHRFERGPDKRLRNLHYFEETVALFDKPEKSPVGSRGMPRITHPPHHTGHMLEEERFVQAGSPLAIVRWRRNLSISGRK